MGFIIMLAIILFYVYTQWRIYEKAGQPGWASIIPIYSTIVLLDIIKKPRHWFFFLLIPLVNIYFIIVIINGLSKSFGKSEGFTVGLIFLSFIFYPILAFGDAEYIYDNVDTYQDNDTDVIDSDMV